MSLLVVPCLVGVAWFHGREDMNKPRMIASHVNNLLDAFFFAEIFLADELDLKPIVRSNPLSILSEFVSKGLCKTGIVKDTNIVIAQETSHSLSVAQRRQSSLNHHAIKTGENSSNLLGVAFCQKHHGYPTPLNLATHLEWI